MFWAIVFCYWVTAIPLKIKAPHSFETSWLLPNNTQYNPEDLNPYQHHSEDLSYNINLVYAYLLSVPEFF